MDSAVAYAHIRSEPGKLSGLPHVAGTRIRVADVAVLARRGISPLEILDAFEHLTLGQVHSALAYYHDHRDEVDQSIEALRATAEEFRTRHPGLVR